MEERPEHDSRTQGAKDSGARAKGPAFGLIAGLAATIVIDLVTMGVVTLHRIMGQVSSPTLGQPSSPTGGQRLRPHWASIFTHRGPGVFGHTGPVGG